MLRNSCRVAEAGARGEEGGGDSAEPGDTEPDDGVDAPVYLEQITHMYIFIKEVLTYR